MKMSHDPDLGALQARLQIDTPLGSFLGAQRIVLLEAIDRQGSIARAARAVGMSYKAAWEAVDDMNHLSSEALVIRSVGGVRGGGTTLTGYGQRLIVFYRTLEREQQACLLRLQAAAEGRVGDLGSFQQLLRRLSMQTSARNQLAGTVLAVEVGPVQARVELGLVPGLSLLAMVTAESLERMALRVGAEVCALIKSSSVSLASASTDPGSTPNRFRGQVMRVLRGPGHAEVTLQLSGERLQLASVVTDEQVRQLDLRPGSDVAACFEASSVTLVVMA